MIHPVAKTALAVPVVAYGWMASASAIYLAGTDKLDLFRFPFTQWLQAAPWWRLNWIMTLWVGLSAAVPTLVLLLCMFGLVRHGWRNRDKPKSVYGDTGWATPRQRTEGGISGSRSPF